MKMRRFYLFYYALIFILNILSIQSLKILKTIYIGNNKYYMITTDTIYYYTDGATANQKSVTTFKNDQIITTYEESEMIGYIFDSENLANVIFVKHYFYGILDDIYFCNTPINEIKGYYSEVFGIKCSLGTCYFIKGIINSDKKLQLFLIKSPSLECKSEIISNIEINNVDSKNINCQLMKSSSNDEVLTCFYQSSNEIIASSFNVIIEITKKKIELISSLTNSKINGGAKIIKSILSKNGKKALVCYTNNDKECYCLTYDITKNEWSDYDTYLNNCSLDISSLIIDYSDNKKEYVVYCFQSSTKFMIQKFDENFGKKEDEENGNYDLKDSLNSCNEYYLSSLEYKSNNLNMFVICDNNIKKLGIKDARVILTTLPETTILTTLPETTSLNLFPATTFLTPLTTFNIHSTMPLLSSSIIHNFQNNDIFQEKTNKTKEYIINNIDNALNDYDISKIYEIFGEDYTIKISPINLNMNKNITTNIDFSNCEKILREKNGLSESSPLILYQIEIDNLNQQSLINHVEYAVFNENKTKLDLSVCENEFIEIKYKINTSMINTTKVRYYANLGIDIFNIKDQFFNDICYSYSEGDSDIILNDRVTDIYQNISFCDNNCNYNKFNLSENTISCICSIKKEVSTEFPPPRLAEIIRDTFKDSNLGVIRCYNLVFSFKNKLKNKGFWIFTILVFLHFPFFIYYFIYNISLIRKYIYVEMEKFHYCYQKINPPKSKTKEQKKKKSEKNNNKNHFKEKLKESKCSNTTKMVLIKTKSINKNMPSINKNKNYFYNLQLKSSRNLLKNNTKKTLSTKEIKHKDIRRPIIFFNYKINNCINNNIKSIKNIKSNNNILKKSKKKVLLSPNYYSLILIDAKNSSKDKSSNSNFILDSYDYESALKYDKRNYWRLVYICILAKENIINILFFKTPLDIQSLRACLFIFTYSCDLAFNTIFFTNEKISDKYHYQGNNLFLFTMVNNFLQTTISSLAGLILVNIFQHMIDSRSNFEDIFKKEEKKMRKDKHYKVNKNKKYKIIEKVKKISSKLKCCIRIFIIIEFIIMIFFYYFVTAFL